MEIFLTLKNIRDKIFAQVTETIAAAFNVVEESPDSTERRAG